MAFICTCDQIIKCLLLNILLYRYPETRRSRNVYFLLLWPYRFSACCRFDSDQLLRVSCPPSNVDSWWNPKWRRPWPRTRPLESLCSNTFGLYKHKLIHCYSSLYAYILYSVWNVEVNLSYLRLFSMTREAQRIC